MKRYRVLFALAALLTAAQVVAGAPILLGTIGAGGASTLVQLNPSTGAVIDTIGPVGYAVSGLTWDPVSGKLYASTSVNDPLYNGLIQVNPGTGAGTPVAGGSGWGLGATASVTNITVNSAGQMYGWWDADQDDLVSIDKSTGEATRVGESGVSTTGSGLSFDNNGVLYMVDNNGSYYTVNTGTGAVGFTNNLGTGAQNGAFSPVDGFYYGIDQNGDSGNPRNLVVADFSTNTSGSTPTANDLTAITFSDNVALIENPEPGTIILLGAGFGVLALFRRR